MVRLPWCCVTAWILINFVCTQQKCTCSTRSTCIQKLWPALITCTCTLDCPRPQSVFHPDIQARGGKVEFWERERGHFSFDSALINVFFQIQRGGHFESKGGQMPPRPPINETMVCSINATWNIVIYWNRICSVWFMGQVWDYLCHVAVNVSLCCIRLWGMLALDSVSGVWRPVGSKFRVVRLASGCGLRAGVSKVGVANS